MNIQETSPLIYVDLTTKKVTLNDLAKRIFKLNKEIEQVIKSLNLNLKVDFCIHSNQTYVVNIIKSKKDLYLLFSEVETSKFCGKLESETSVIENKKDVLANFMKTFLALKKRYGGFNIKFLYLKIKFNLDLSEKLKQKFLSKILDYILEVTRTSDAIGKIDDNTFGVILINSSNEGSSIVVNKILKDISNINIENDQRLIEVYGVLAHEIFIVRYNEFDKFISILDEQSEFITVGVKLKELVK